MPPSVDKENISWKKALVHGVGDVGFMFGPPAHEHTAPGKSGELIVRSLKNKFNLDSRHLYYPDLISVLKENDRYLLVDDGAFTGDQLLQFIDHRGQFLNAPGRAGIVLSIVHEEALLALNKKYPHIPVFFGEKIKFTSGFQSLSDGWMHDGTWPYDDCTPYETYINVVKTKGNFSVDNPLGFGSLGLLIAYEHGIPDDSLQLLWDESPTWRPLIPR